MLVSPRICRLGCLHPFLQYILVYRQSHLFLKNMCNVIFTDKKLPCKLLQRQFLIKMVINIINNVLIKILFLFLALWILLFVDNTVQLKNKIISHRGKPLPLFQNAPTNLLDQLEKSGYWIVLNVIRSLWKIYFFFTRTFCIRYP